MLISRLNAERMLLARELVTYLSRQLVTRLAPRLIEVSNPEAAAEVMNTLILEELEVEDKMNDEVREILSEYSEYMRREGVSYQEMFKKIKNQMIKERKIVRAAGRDTGDAMKLSRDKITDISHKLLERFRKSREFRLKKDPNEIRLEIVKGITELLVTEDKVDKASRLKVRSQKKDIPEGSEEFDILQKRYYSEEMRKLGVDVGSQSTYSASS